MFLVVYKLGGSLLTLPDLAARLRSFFASRDERPLLVVGGGEAANLVRRWDEQFQIGEECAHWLALRAMALNERLVESILSGSRVVHSREGATIAWEAREIPILCAHGFLAAEERANNNATGGSEAENLPHTWDVTSDSIAAWVALRFAASSLVLLKSCDRPDLLSDGVDPYFCKLEPHLPRVEWINLRATSVLSTGCSVRPANS